MLPKIREIWKETIPKIYEVAHNEPNRNLQDLCDDSCPCNSEGIIMHCYSFIYSTIPLECKTVFAAMMLVHLLPDVRSATNTNKIVLFTDVSINVSLISPLLYILNM